MFEFLCGDKLVFLPHLTLLQNWRFYRCSRGRARCGVVSGRRQHGGCSVKAQASPGMLKSSPVLLSTRTVKAATVKQIQGFSREILTLDMLALTCKYFHKTLIRL